MSPARNGFKGNKRSLPSKPCQACGRLMSWRSRWARVWDEVKYCSDACRRGRAQTGQPSGGQPSTDRPSADRA